MTALAKTATPAATKLDEGQKLRPRYLESLNLVERLHRQLLDVIKDELDRRGAQRRRVPLGGDVALERERHAVDRTCGLAAAPARFAGARLLQRLVGPQQEQRVQVPLPALDVAEHGTGDLHRGEIAPAVAFYEFGGGEFMQRMAW